jgi:hypothetical protein
VATRVLGPIGVSLLAVGAIALAVGLHPSLGFRSAARHAPGIAHCPVGAERDILAPDALQCWMRAPHGLWRIQTHVSAHGALVIETSADDLSDANHIAEVIRRSVDARFSETLLYVRTESGGTRGTVRLRWTRHGPLERLEF